MKIKTVSICLVLFLDTNFAFAGALFSVKGRMTGVKDSKAIIKSVSGETLIPLKKLSKADREKVLAASGSKQEVELMVPPQALTE